jgi:hypothetical protein
MGLFSSPKRISEYKLDEALKHIKELKPSEREYVKGLFSQFTSGGVSRQEVEKGIRRIKTDFNDGVDRHEADKLESALLALLD